MRRLIAGAGFLLLAASAQGETLDVTAEKIDSFQRLSSSEDFAPFTWRGGLSLSSEAPSFGGLSGLVLDEDCERMLAVSDGGNWFEARLRYEGGRLAGISDASTAPVRDSKGKRQKSKAWWDVEALTRLSDGRLLAAFESRVRFGSYDIAGSGLDATFQALPHPSDIDQGPENGEVEAIGQLPDGRLVAIAERQFDADGNIRGWAWKGGKATGFTLERHDAYKVTDLAVDGTGILTLERRFTPGSLPGMAVRRFDASAIGDAGPVRPELLLEATAPLYVIDNMEGIALCTRDGETRVTLLSDDNFNRSVQSTILLQFAYRR